MRKILVTGAAGYIGSVLCQQLLADGFDVTGVDACIYANERSIFHLLGHERFHFSLHDVRDVAGMRPLLGGADAVVPLAAIVGAPACDQKASFARQVNQEAVLGLLKELSPHQRVVYPNTNSGYGQTAGDEHVTEKSPMNPVSLYGVTKAEAEKAVLDHPRGVSLRLATVFGPSPRMRFDLMVNDFVLKLATQGRLEVFEPGFKRNFVHVRDVARAFCRMVTDHRLVGSYNVGLPEANLSKLELARFVADSLGFYPPEVVSVVEGNDPDKRNYLVSNDKLLETGFQFRYDLQQGVLDVAAMVGLLSPPAIARMRNV